MRQRKIKRVSGQAFPPPGILGASRSQPGGTQAWIGKPEPDPEPITLSRAVTDTLLDKQVAGLEGEERDEKLGDILTHTMLSNNMFPVARVKDVPSTETDTTHVPTQPEAPEEEPVTATAPPVTLPPHHGRARSNGKPPLTQQQRDDIAEAFKAGISTTEIQNTWEVGAGVVYKIVREYGLPLRTQRTVVTEVKASEPVSEVSAPSAPPSGVVSDMPEWVVTYEVRRTETVTVAARDFNAAAYAIHSSENGAEVLSVARKRA